MSKCKSCGARIDWATTPNGKLIPLDAIVVADGNIRAERPYGDTNLRATVVPQGEGDRVSHFVTCPNAREHRKPK